MKEVERPGASGEESPATVGDGERQGRSKVEDEPGGPDGLEFRRDLMHHVHEAVARAYQEQPPDSYARMPSKSELSELFTALFWASLATDEGRTTIGSLAFFCEDSSRWSSWSPFNENHRRVANAATIRKLLHAIVPEAGALVVAGNRVLGITYQVPESAVIVSAEGPAEIVVRVGRRVVGCFADAQWQALGHVAGRVGEFTPRLHS